MVLWTAIASSWILWNREAQRCTLHVTPCPAMSCHQHSTCRFVWRKCASRARSLALPPSRNTISTSSVYSISLTTTPLPPLPTLGIPSSLNHHLPSQNLLNSQRSSPSILNYHTSTLNNHTPCSSPIDSHHPSPFLWNNTHISPSRQVHAGYEVDQCRVTGKTTLGFKLQWMEGKFQTQLRQKTDAIVEQLKMY